MAKMQEALTPLELRRLDRWLEHHANDAFKGDGQPLWPDWQTYSGENASKTEIANVPQTSKRPRQKSVDLIEETPQEKHVLVQVV
jgi:hypothetical protein